MPSLSATASIAFCGSQPPACSCARHNSGITADACRPAGYFWISRAAQFSLSAVKANSWGWTSAEARRRLDMDLLDSTAARLFLKQLVIPDIEFGQRCKGSVATRIYKVAGRMGSNSAFLLRNRDPEF